MHPTNESRPLRMPHIGNTPAECAVDLVWVGFFRCYEELQTTFCKEVVMVPSEETVDCVNSFFLSNSNILLGTNKKNLEITGIEAKYIF